MLRDGSVVWRARAACFVLAVVVVTTIGQTAAAHHQSGSPVGAFCYLVADQGDFPGDRDLLTLVDTGRPSPPGPNESAMGFTGTLGIEALAGDPSDRRLFAADEAILGTLDEHTGAFTAVTGDPFGPGTGAQGSQSLKNADGLSFDPTDGTLYASIRRGTGREDLLIKVDTKTGHHINDAFGPGRDYAVVSAPNSLDDIDDIAFDSAGRLWAIINDGGINSTVVRIDKHSGALDPAYSPKKISGHTNATDMESLAWADEQGTPTLFGVNGRAVTGTTQYVNRLWEIDPATGMVALRSTIGESAGVAGARDYEGIVCSTGRGCDLFPDAVPMGRAGSGARHTLTIRLAGCVGPIQGARPTITVDPPDDEVGNTCETQGTDATGACTVTLDSPDAAGTTQVSASVSGSVNGKPFSLQDSTRMVWIGTGMCLDFATPTERLPLVVSFAVPDADPQTTGQQGLSDVIVTADLPQGITVSSAARIANVAPTISGTPPRVRYRFPSLAPGAYSGRILASLSADVPDDTPLTNRVSIEAGGYAGAVSTTHGLVVTNDTSARAFGFRADLLGDGYVLGDDLSPDTDTGGRGEQVNVPNPLPGATAPLARSITVSESVGSDAHNARTTALAEVLEADINIPGVVQVQADAVVARATSTASGNSAASTSAGSMIANLRIGGVRYGDVSEPTTIVFNGIDGDPWIEVRLLEHVVLGEGKDEGHANDTAVEVNGIHIVVRDVVATPADESSDVIMAHARAFAEFGPSIDCGAGPVAFGDASVLDVLDPTTGHAIAGHVALPRSGGGVEDRRTDLALPIGTADAAASGVSGTVGFGPPSAEASAFARVGRARFADGALILGSVQATSECTLVGCAGDTTIANLVIGSTTVCTALGLASTCEPAPNTVLLLPAPGPVLIVLNEHIPEPGGLTINAVHLFVLGRDNPLGLPVGAEIIIGAAHAGASSAT